MLHFLFIHGTFGSAEDWNETRQFLHQIGNYSTSAIDLPAHAGKAPMSHQDLFQQMIDEVAQAVQGPTLLVGYSLGGRVALHLTKKLQNVGQNPIQALILEGAHPGISDPQLRDQRKFLDAQRATALRETDSISFLDTWYQQPLFGDLATNPQKRKALVHRRARDLDAQTLARVFEECSPGHVESLWDFLPSLRVPLAFFYGDRDATYQSVARDVKSIRPDSTCESIPNAGHNAHRDAPKAFAEALHHFAQSLPNSAKGRSQTFDSSQKTTTLMNETSPKVPTKDSSASTEKRQTPSILDSKPTPNAAELQTKATIPTHFVGNTQGAGPILWTEPPLIVLQKPSGVLVHNSAFAGLPEETLLDLAEAELQRRIFPLHRIDRGTSGIVLAVDTVEQTTEWMAALRADDSIREYVAIVRGHLRERVRVERPVPNEKGDAQEALSFVAPLCTSPSEHLSLVRVRIVTGRRHQVRRHCRSLNHPIIGDATWGNSKLNRELRERLGVDRMALHAWRIQFSAPNGRRYDLACPPDAAFQDLCRRVFDFESWEALADAEPLDEEVERVHR